MDLVKEPRFDLVLNVVILDYLSISLSFEMTYSVPSAQ